MQTRKDVSADDVERFAEKLPPRYLAILRLDTAKGSGGGYAGIAATLNLPLGSVKSRLHRARQSINRLLLDEAANGRVPA